MTNNPGAILWEKYLQVIHQLTENWRKAGEGWREEGWRKKKKEERERGKERKGKRKYVEAEIKK